MDAFPRNNIFGYGTRLKANTLGARGLYAPHPDGLPKAGKTSGQHEANEVSDFTHFFRFVLSARLPPFGRPSGWRACRPLTPRVSIQQDVAKTNFFLHFNQNASHELISSSVPTIQFLIDLDCCQYCCKGKQTIWCFTF